MKLICIFMQKSSLNFLLNRWPVRYRPVAQRTNQWGGVRVDFTWSNPLKIKFKLFIAIIVNLTVIQV